MDYGPWGLSFWELIVLIWVIAWAFKPRGQAWKNPFEEYQRKHAQEKDEYEEALAIAEDKIEELRDRVKVLEKIVTDSYQANTLSEEIENLRRSNG